MRVIRDALVWLLPLLMAWSALQFAAALLDFLNLWPTMTVLLTTVNAAAVVLLPYGLTIAVSTMLAIQYQLPRPPVGLLGLGYFAIIMGVVEPDSLLSKTMAVFVALMLPFLAVPLLARLSQRQWTRLSRADLAGRHVQTNINLVIPAVLLTLAVALLGLLLTTLLDASASYVPELPDAVAREPALAGLIFAALNSLFWMLGVHGYYALLPLLQALDAANLPEMRLSNLLGAFVFIGGSGATLSLSVALILFGRQRPSRVMGFASLPIGMFNVNELLIFGLPIVFNRRLLVPFFVVPAVNVLIASTALASGLITLSPLEVPFTSPIVANAWIASGGNLSGVVLQLVCLLIGVGIYAPFVRWHEARTAPHHIHLRCFETTFVQREEELAAMLSDPVGQQNRRVSDQRRLATQLGALSEREFFLQYQPVVGVLNPSVQGCEALMRMRLDDGRIGYPGSFMDAFARAGLQRRIDLWSMEQAAQQQSEWTRSGLKIPISVNISADSLASNTQVDNLLRVLKQCPGPLNLEVTEQSLAGDIAQVERSLARLRDVGARVYIDDFGTGYSSLSYLHHFPVDVIKIDRSFVLGLGHPRGRQVFDGLIALAQRLEIDIVVEGVETREQLACLPCSPRIAVQGWLYSRSLDGDQMPQFVRQFAAHAN